MECPVVLPTQVAAEPMDNNGGVKSGDGHGGEVENVGQGNGPLSRAALCSKNWIKTPYDLVNVLHSHQHQQAI